MGSNQLEETIKEENTQLIEGYNNTLDICVQNKLDIPIPCSFKENTLVFLKMLFKHSNSEILLFTDDLSEEIYGPPLKKEALNFLSKNTDNKILITYNTDLPKEEILHNSFLKTLIDNQNDIKGFFSVWKLDKYTFNFPLREYTNHFVVSDRIAYMHEINDKRKFGNFNNENVARSFAYDFFQIIKISEEVYKNKKINLF